MANYFVLGCKILARLLSTAILTGTPLSPKEKTVSKIHYQNCVKNSDV